MRKFLLGAVFAALAPAMAFAGPTYTFGVSQGVQPSNVGTITPTQINANTVNVLVDLNDTSVPLPRYGFLNTGGPHTPFGFNLSNETGVSISFLQPAGGGLFSVDFNGGDATPFGTFGVGINYAAGNGSGAAYYGDLEFRATKASGLSTDDFIANGVGGFYFAADLTDGGSNTGSQAWKIRNTPPTDVPEPATIGLLGMGLVGLGTLARRRRSN